MATVGVRRIRGGDPAHEPRVTSVTFAQEGAGVEDARVEAALATVLVVLVAGVFVGNLYASRRRRVPRVSIYDLIRRRLESQDAEGHEPR